MTRATKKRDLPALGLAYEEAVHKGFVHRGLRKAAAVLEWEASPADVVLSDQAAARARGRCSREGSGCPRGSFALLSGCEVATCIRVPRGGENSSMLSKKEALERAVPALLTSTDLRSFNKATKTMAKLRRKVYTHYR